MQQIKILMANLALESWNGKKKMWNIGQKTIQQVKKTHLNSYMSFENHVENMYRYVYTRNKLYTIQTVEFSNFQKRK